MRICVIGAGYVGLATAVMFAKLGHKVVCADVDERRVRDIQAGRSPFYEPPLEKELGKFVRSGALTASTDSRAPARDSKFIFICVQTPSLSSGRIDLRPLKAASRVVAKTLASSKEYKVVVVKSTVVPSTTVSVVRQILEGGSGKTAGEDFGLCMNPEFLQEGSALRDSMKPSRVVVGAIDRRSGDALMRLYAPIKADKVRTDLSSAEMIKYASNAFLAMKISYANEMANMCARLGIDSGPVLEAVGKDPRIGSMFLTPGLGFGGSCLPKDVKALRHKTKALGLPAKLMSGVLAVNDDQPFEAIELLNTALGSLRGRRVAVLGLSFKGGVSDVRDSRAIPLIAGLLAGGAEVVAFDPMSMSQFIELMPAIQYASSAKDALNGADACVVQSDWPEFSRLGKKEFSRMRNAIVVDGRRCLDPAKVERAGARYLGVGYGVASK
ncbi:MAG: UDP-glucose/GDP-mannose dehydrogenase family protein [Methanobacteriota archaeon]|nr:MAG: UDP-glucose/GDP-mannose dehydrogenase family protein [Euryarchaeota archaeon]